MRNLFLAVTAVLLAACAGGNDTCDRCAEGVPITLAWDANAPEDMVLGYRLYFGPTEDPASMGMADDIAVTDLADPALPQVSYDAWLDFGLHYGDTACFRLTAYNAGGESAFSNAACKTVVEGNPMQFGL